eukprot:s171_g42.t1
MAPSENKAGEKTEVKRAQHPLCTLELPSMTPFQLAGFPVSTLEMPDDHRSPLETPRSNTDVAARSSSPQSPQSPQPMDEEERLKRIFGPSGRPQAPGPLRPVDWPFGRCPATQVQAPH